MIAVLVVAMVGLCWLGASAAWYMGFRQLIDRSTRIGGRLVPEVGTPADVAEGEIPTLDSGWLRISGLQLLLLCLLMMLFDGASTHLRDILLGMEPTSSGAVVQEEVAAEKESVADGADPKTPGIGAFQVGALFVALCVTRGAEIALLLGICLFLWKLPPPALGLHRTNLGTSLVRGVAEAVAILPFVCVLNGLLRNLLGQETPHPVQTTLRDGGLSPLGWGGLFVAVVIAAPLLEELACRGILQQWIKSRRGEWMGIVGTSVIFALLHSLSWPDPIAIFVLSLGLGRTLERSGSLWASVGMHATFNGANLIVGLVLLRFLS